MDHGANSIFIQLASILGLSSVMGYIVKSLRLPLLIAYLLVGVLLSTLQIFDVQHSEVLKFLPEIGIAIVLFLVGMELDFKELKHLGKPIFAAALIQIILAIIAGFTIAQTLGFDSTTSFYLGVGLSFSSTIVVVKLLLEHNDLSSLYGKLSLGILLVEDLVAILLLMVMTVGSSALGTGLQDSWPLLTLGIKGLILLLTTFILARFLLNRLFKAVASSAELLFLSALAWCFVFVASALFLGFSVVIGAFLAGVALANSPFHYEIQTKIKPLRDFFVTLFFVYLGAQVVFSQIFEVLPLVLIFTLYALFFKPLVFLLVLGIFGFRKHTLFQTALNLSNISEFSLIIMVVGLQNGVVGQSALTAMALTGVISIIVSSTMISKSRQLYKIVKPLAGFFEHKSFTHQSEENKTGQQLENHIILIGAHRIGGEIIRYLEKTGIPFLVVDFNPKIISELMNQKIHALYGDIGDPEILEFLNINGARMVISTAQDRDDNLMLTTEVKKQNSQAVLITRASSIIEAEELYKAGSDYVILPETISGDHLVNLLKNHWPSLSYFKDRSEKELERLSKSGLAA